MSMALLAAVSVQANLISEDQARQLLAQQRSVLGLTQKDLDQSKVLSAYPSQHNGVSHYVFQQHINGIEVAGGSIQLNVDRNGEVINTHNHFISAVEQNTKSSNHIMPADQAVMKVAAQLGIQTRMPTYALKPIEGINQATTMNGDGISLQDIPVKLVYQKDAQGQAVLSWDMQILQDENWWSIRADAETGAVLSQHNWYAHASYDVIPFPNESPANTGYALATVTDPDDLDASPFGWHDTDGSAGAEFTDTRGNNVFAQDDLDANNSGGSRPDGGASLVFDVPWNPLVNPDEEQNLDAAIVNLFYWNNITHDLTYHYGFDEASGNFQENNYGNGGFGGDAVNADAQDGSGTNNANFGTPPDGQNPRMQMFYFVLAPTFTINAPNNIAGQYETGGGFGGDLTKVGITGTIELADDGVDTTSDGCTSLTGFTGGNIALIDRGECEFGVKALNAENAGASAVIIVNNQGNDPMSMSPGAVGDQVTIPVMSLGQSNGDLIKSELQNGVNATMAKAGADRDSDMDNGIIIHEYGHGISNRLTGGPSQASCLQTTEQMGEGWSDFFALFMTAQVGDTADQARPMGSYATQIAGGIRTYPYSRDTNINPHTFGDIVNADNGTRVSPHYVGSVWAVMLWDMYWNLVDEHGFDADLYRGTGGNNIAMQLVMDGLKLQGCNPGFIDGRDAILQADQVNYSGANQCQIWHAFAKRGLGEGASSGSVFAVGDETESFDVPAACDGPSDLIFADDFE